MSSFRTVRRSAPRAPARQRGLSLIEVLVSVLVLGMGLLGLAMLQATNLRLAQSSNQRTIATNLASDLLDDIRSNRLLAAQYDGTYTASSVAANTNCAQLNTLTPAQRKTAFTCRMREALGEGATATVTVSANRNVNIVIQWGDAQRWSALADPTKFQTDSAL